MSLRQRALAAYARRGWRGFDRLLRLTGHRPGARLRAQSRYGTWFELDPWSYIDRYVLKEGYYESEVLEAVLAGLERGGVLWDVGANIGLHAVTAKRLVPQAQVVCFEPSPAVLGRLWRHAEMNGTDLKILALALSDRAGLEVLHVATAGNTGRSSLGARAGVDYAGTSVVRTEPGDALVAAGLVPEPTVIKLDVEGHETPVLKGLARTLGSPACRRVVFEDAPEAATPVKGLLTGAGFRIERLARREATQTEVENFLAVK